jgi:uncharacterized membrane protein YhaH (DUF805 family)
MIKEYIAYLKDNPQGYWFKARLYGWGWAPAKKAGWLVLLVYIAVIIVAGLLGGSRMESSEQFLKWYLPLIIISTAVFIWICYKKGEKPRWMWGPPDKYKTRC